MRTGLVARSEKIWDSPLSLSPRDVVFERYRRFADRAFIGVCEPPSLEATEKELPMWDNKQQRPLAKSARARLATRRIDPAVLLRYDVHGRWTAVARRGHRSIVVVQENGGSQNHYCVNVGMHLYSVSVTTL